MCRNVRIIFKTSRIFNFSYYQRSQFFFWLLSLLGQFLLQHIHKSFSFKIRPLIEAFLPCCRKSHQHKAFSILVYFEGLRDFRLNAPEKVMTIVEVIWAFLFLIADTLDLGIPYFFDKQITPKPLLTSDKSWTLFANGNWLIYLLSGYHTCVSIG